MKITIKYKEFEWRPAAPPDQNEYLVLRSLDEDGMKKYLKVLITQETVRLAGFSPYRYRTGVIGVLAGAALVWVASYLKEDGVTGWEKLISSLGWIVIGGCVIHGISASLTNDSIRKNMIPAREYYVRCWAAAQKLDYPSFTQHMAATIQRSFPERKT